MSNFEELKNKVIEWGHDKDIMDPYNNDKQFLKFVEEVLEFKTEMDKLNSYDLENRDTINDYVYTLQDMEVEMGDIFVTLIILSEQLDIDPVECLEKAYNKIKGRKGKTINGLFVKEEDL